MTGLIGADTAEMRTMIQAMRRASDEIQQRITESRQSMGAMQNGPWSGHHRTVLEGRWHTLDSQFMPLVETLDDLALRVERVAQALEAAGAAFGDQASIPTNGERSALTEFLDFLRTLGLIIELNPDTPDSIEGRLKFLQWFGLFAADRAKTREAFRMVGRLINELTGTEGAVSRMDELYRFIARQLPYRGDVNQLLKNRILSNGLDVVEGFLNVHKDIEEGNYNGDLTKIIGVNSINTGLNIAIGSTVAGTAVLLANGAVQIGSTAQVAIQKTLADWIATDAQTQEILKKDAENVEGTIERMDLGRITKRFSETLYDSSIAPRIDLVKDAYYGVKDNLGTLEDLARDPSWDKIAKVSQSINEFNREHWKAYLPGPAFSLILTEEGRNGLYETGKEAVNVLQGGSDYMTYSIASANNMGIALGDKIVDVLPLPDNLKQWTHAAAQEVMLGNQQKAEDMVRRNNDATQKLLDLSDKAVGKIGDFSHQAGDKLRSVLNF